MKTTPLQPKIKKLFRKKKSEDPIPMCIFNPRYHGELKPKRSFEFNLSENALFYPQKGDTVRVICDDESVDCIVEGIKALPGLNFNVLCVEQKRSSSCQSKNTP